MGEKMGVGSGVVREMEGKWSGKGGERRGGRGWKGGDFALDLIDCNFFCNFAGCLKLGEN